MEEEINNKDVNQITDFASFAIKAEKIENNNNYYIDECKKMKDRCDVILNS